MVFNVWEELIFIEVIKEFIENQTIPPNNHESTPVLKIENDAQLDTMRLYCLKIENESTPILKIENYDIVFS